MELGVGPLGMAMEKGKGKKRGKNHCGKEDKNQMKYQL